MESKKISVVIKPWVDDMDTAFIEIPFDVEKTFGQKRPKIKAIFDNKVEYRGLLTRMKTECHILGLRQDIRKSLGKGVGDIVDVEIFLDQEPRIVDVPEYLKSEIQKNKALWEIFEKLSFTQKKEFVNSVTEAKKEETRLKRIEKIITELSKKLK